MIDELIFKKRKETADFIRENRILQQLTQEELAKNQGCLFQQFHE